MADRADNTCAAAWERLSQNLTHLHQDLERAQPEERDALEQAVISVQDDLLSVPAPTLDAVIAKLRILWEATLAQPDQVGREQRLIISDLMALSATA